MSKRRLIPKLLIHQSPILKRPVLVTTTQFDRVSEIADPVSQAKIYEAQVADELLFVNIRPDTLSAVSVAKLMNRVSEEIFMPVTIGGGVTTLEDFELYLSNGADKILVTTACVKNPKLVREASEKYGAQCVVAGIDYRELGDGKSLVYVDGGKTSTRLSPIDLARQAEQLGAGEICLTSISRDGMREGLDIKTIDELSKSISIPVIVSGGCGFTEHFVEGFRAGAMAVSAGTYFAFKDENPMQTRSHIRNAGFPVRII